MFYSDFSFTDYVGVSIECDLCHRHSPEFRNAADMFAWIDDHIEDCTENADL